jgi:sporulation protein YlmC with PRC-barrel domain
MMWIASKLQGYTLDATDGQIGSVTDILFDDRSWLVRWLVVDTGGWLPDRQVILPPVALVAPDEVQRRIPVALTRQQVRESPGLATDSPVSRQNETDYYRYWGGTPYWAAAGTAAPATGAIALPPRTPVSRAYARRIAQHSEDSDPGLRSMNEVTGYTIHATDGDIGHVEDFVVDDEDWAVRYLVIDTVNWWPGKKVLVAPEWLGSISWTKQQVSVGLDRAAVKASPEWSGAEAPGRFYEERLHRHYGYAGYWI